MAVRFRSSLLSSRVLGEGRVVDVQRLFRHTHGKVIFDERAVTGIHPLLGALSYRGSDFCSLVGLLIVLRRLSLSGKVHRLSAKRFTVGSISGRRAGRGLGGILSCIRFRFSRIVHLTSITGVMGVDRTSFYHFVGRRASGDFVSFLASVHLKTTSHTLISSSLSVTRVKCSYNFGGLSGFGHVFGGGGKIAPGRFHSGCHGGGAVV